MTKGSALHTVFGPSAAGSLRHALKLAERNEQVVCPSDDFSFGPIARGAAEKRAQWVDDVLGYSGWQDVIDETARSWAALSASRPVIWVSVREARSYAGFLQWLSQTEEGPCSIMIVPDLSLRSAEEFVEILDREEVLAADDKERWVARWRILQSEDAPLPVIAGNELVSAPLSQFDAALMAAATTHWQPMAKIVASVLSSFHVNGIYQTGDLVLASRLAELAETGTFKWRGDLSQMHGCELRLALSGSDGKACGDGASGQEGGCQNPSASLPFLKGREE